MVDDEEEGFRTLNPLAEENKMTRERSRLCSYVSCTYAFKRVLKEYRCIVINNLIQVIIILSAFLLNLT